MTAFSFARAFVWLRRFVITTELWDEKMCVWLDYECVALFGMMDSSDVWRIHPVRPSGEETRTKGP
jgi:hypothetical protein